MSHKQRVAIVGAGSAGLAALQQLLDVGSDSECELTVFEPVVFERRGDIGGLWNLELDPGPCHVVNASESATDAGKVNPGNYAYSKPGEVHATSAMYEGLRVNVPSVRCS